MAILQPAVQPPGTFVAQNQMTNPLIPQGVNTAAPTAAPVSPAAPPPTNSFNFDMNANPYSNSQSSSSSSQSSRNFSGLDEEYRRQLMEGLLQQTIAAGQGLNRGPYSTSDSYQGSDNQSFSGLAGGQADPFLQQLMPVLNNSIANMEGNIDAYTNQAMGSYQNMFGNMLRNQMPTAVGNLANRGIMSSTAGSDAMGRVMSDAARWVTKAIRRRCRGP